MATVPMELLRHYVGGRGTKRHQIKAAAFMKRFGAVSGAGGKLFMVLPPNAPRDANYQSFHRFFQDVVHHDGDSAISVRGSVDIEDSFDNRIGGRKDGKPRDTAMREDATGYQTSPRVAEAHTVKYTGRRSDLEVIMQEDSKNAAQKIAAFLKDPSGVASTAREGLYKLLTLRQFTEVADKAFGGRDKNPIRKYGRVVQSMMTDRQERVNTAGVLADEVKRWARSNEKQAGKLFDLMNDATLFQMDPDGDFNIHRYGNKLKGFLKTAEAHLGEAIARGSDPVTIQNLERRVDQIKRDIAEFNENGAERYAELSSRFKALPNEAKEFYRRMRQIHVDDNKTYHDTVLQRIENSGLDSARVKVMRAQIELEKAYSEATGPYFPLGRFGDHTVEFIDQNGERVVYAFESAAEARRSAANLEKVDGITGVEMKTRTERDYKIDGASFEFLNDLFSKIEETQLDPTDKASLAETVYQLYLQHLPERSMKKNRIRRRGVAGYSNDALRSFATTAMKSAYQLSRLRHIDQFNTVLSDVREATQAPGTDSDVRAEIYNELKKRHEWVLNPKNAKWSRGLTALGFTYMLGVSPMAAIVNMTQTFNVGIPIILSRMKQGGNPLTIAKDVVAIAGGFIKDSFNHRKVGFDETRSGGYLTADEKRALTEWRKNGSLDQTATHNLLGIADLGAQDAEFSERTSQVLEWIGKLFHSAEVMNREVTGLAAYRAFRRDAKKQGMSDADAHSYAVAKAGDTIWDSHFDYTNVNRAPFMQSDIAKVMFQFKQYSQQMAYYLTTNAIRAGRLMRSKLPEGLGGKKLSAEDIAIGREAATQLLGTLTVTGLMGGAMALPMTWAVKAMANALLGGGDEPWDAELAAQKWLADTVGAEVANRILYGAGGAGFSQRVQLNNLWYQDPFREPRGGESWWTHVAKQLAGPTLGGIAINQLDGWRMIGEGEVYRGVEKLVPKFARDMMVAGRFSQEGAVNLRGDVIRPLEEFTFMDLFLQANGLANGDVVRQYKINTGIRKLDDRLKERRRRMLDAFYLSAVDGDAGRRKQVLDEIREFNESMRANYPEAMIDRRALQQSVRSRQSRTQNTDRGLYLDGTTTRVRDRFDWTRELRP